MEKYDRDLHQYTTESDPGNFNSYVVWKLFISLAASRVLTRLHSIKYLHRDFKGPNLLLKGDFLLVMNDFGFGKQMSKFKTRLGFNNIDSLRTLGSKIFRAPKSTNILYIPEKAIFTPLELLFSLFSTILIICVQMTSIFT